MKKLPKPGITVHGHGHGHGQKANLANFSASVSPGFPSLSSTCRGRCSWCWWCQLSPWWAPVRRRWEGRGWRLSTRRRKKRRRVAGAEKMLSSPWTNIFWQRHISKVSANVDSVKPKSLVERLMTEKREALLGDAICSTYISLMTLKREAAHPGVIQGWRCATTSAQPPSSENEKRRNQTLKLSKKVSFKEYLCISIFGEAHLRGAIKSISFSLWISWF